jgi:hypothetical protein
LRQVYPNAWYPGAMKNVMLALLTTICVAGCQSPESAPESPAKAEVSTTPKETAPENAPTEPVASETKAVVAAGMDMAEVKKLKGAPKDTKHEHGPNGSEVDLWIYDDETVRFQDGKVSQ